MNPFVYNCPVRGKDFFNREKTIEKILTETITGKSQGNIWITGERQIGKSSLLRHIQNLNETTKYKITPYGSQRNLDVAFVYSNVQGCESEEVFFDTLWQNLKDYFDFKRKKITSGYENFIRGIQEAYSERNFYVLFLIDEFDAFIQTIAYKDPSNATRFLAKLSSLLQEVDEVNEGSKSFGCVFTANHDMKELLNENLIDSRGSGLIVEAINLKWFTRAQVQGLAKTYLKDNEIQFSEMEIDLCYGATHGYPYFTQKMMSLMYDARKNIKDEKEYIKLVKQEFGEMFEETLEDWGGDNMPVRTLKKLRDLVKSWNIGPAISKVLFTTLELYIKNKTKL